MIKIKIELNGRCGRCENVHQVTKLDVEDNQGVALTALSNVLMQLELQGWGSLASRDLSHAFSYTIQAESSELMGYTTIYKQKDAFRSIEVNMKYC